MFSVGDIMQTNVVTVSEDATAFDIATIIIEKHISCVVVMGNVIEDAVVFEKPSFLSKILGRKERPHVEKRTSKKPMGLITERDFTQKVLTADVDASRFTASEMMSPGIISLESNATIVTAIGLMKKNGFRRIPVMEDGKLVGLVTQTDILLASMSFLEKLQNEMNNNSVDMDEYKELLSTSSELYNMPEKDVTVDDTVDKIMIQKVFIESVKTLVSESANVMADKRYGCVIVMKGSSPVGIVSEKDLIKKVVLGKLDPEKITLGQVMTSPIFSVRTTTKISEATEIMKSKGFKRLPVVDDGILKGIVTQSDVRLAMGSAIRKAQSTFINQWADLLQPAFSRKH
ncbi:hypothetical protein COV93_03180 [Candidatus Woesearchaeota archaeon CG11_big_fil_rev_8_21_14_0_20_43_8]|nr:MAG: hypothetical protein COV93_03180 [Candidatus Woesearchaeota archaeon CG11_big_fil_rev_8_21_14_0_20_43_8]PIO05633.1 MAG: hypothetical protein COT47_03995 [Candidatus Woesearchaeota archaeon CG08_land_8_20_14_0_20_43_7]